MSKIMESPKCPHDIANDELFRQWELCKDKKKEVVSFFLSSLSTGNMLWRSFLPAFGIARTFPRHHFDGNLDSINDKPCGICGDYSWDGIKEQDYEFVLGVASRAGGIPVYTLKFCIVLLSEFNKISSDIIKPNETDFTIFSDIMDCLMGASIQDTLKKDIVRKIKGIRAFKTNKDQTKNLLQTLGYCGILETKQHKSPFHGYINLGLAPKRSHNSDWEYPVDFWTPADGINREAFKFWFGNYPELSRFWE